MATIKLDDIFSVETDKYNFSLKYKNTYFDGIKNKEITNSDEWHFPKLSLAIDKYMNESLKPNQEIIDLLSELKRIETLISKL